MDFVCNKCGTRFNENEADTEKFVHDEVRPTFVEHYYSCPNCGSMDFEEAMECLRCKRKFPAGELHGMYYCTECMEELMDTVHMKQFIREDMDSYADWIHELRQRNNADGQES